MGARVHHSAVCVRDVAESMRFYRDGLGLELLMDHTFTGDWPTLFDASSTTLRSIFLGDPRHPDAGVVELVVFDPSPEPPPGAGHGARPRPDRHTPAGPPVAGFFLLSLFVPVAETLDRLAALGYGDVRRIEQPGPSGPVSMVAVRDPDGVVVELIDTGGGPR
jgi:glyoxylase I family protein